MSKKKKRRLIPRIIRAAVLLLTLGVLGVLAWFVWLPSIKASVTVTYDSYTATVGSISNSLSFSGSVSVINSGYAVSTASGSVRTVYVADGDTVSKGDKLVRLSSGETVKADFDGTINDVYVEAGDDVSANAQLCQLVDFQNMKVTMRVDEYDISEVYVGQACEVTFTALEKTFPSQITHINRLSASSGSVAYYTVTATVEVTEDVLPGMQVTVQIPQEEAEDVVIIKMDALSFDSSNSAYVYLMKEDGTLETRYVEVGVDNGNYVEITSGLSEGDVAYVEAEEEETASTGLAGLISGLTGGNNATFNAPTGGSMPSFDRNSGGTRDFSGMGGSSGGGMGGGMGGGSR